MTKILTAMGTENLINKLKENENLWVYEKDIPYREGIVELLKHDDEFNIIIISSCLPGQINFEDLIKDVKLINQKINIIFLIENKNNILEKNSINENIKIFYKHNFNWNEFILYIKNINKKLDNKRNIELNKNEKINNKRNIELNKNEKINNKKNIELNKNEKMNNKRNVVLNKNEKFNNETIMRFNNEKINYNYIEEINLNNKNIVENKTKNMQNKYLINNKKKEINNFNRENELINNKLDNEKISNNNEKKNKKVNLKEIANKNNKLNLEEIKEKNNNKRHKKKKDKNKKKNKITIISKIEKNKINNILEKYIKDLDSINKNNIYFVRFNNINKNIKYSEKIIFIATTEFDDVKKLNNLVTNIQNKYDIKSEKINILFLKKKDNSINMILLKNLFKKYKILKKIKLKQE